MSGGAVRAFLPALREVERELTLPLPERTHILREIESDLEDLQERLVAEGVSPDQARRRALEALLPGVGELGELGRLHTPLYRRVTGRIADDTLRLTERSVLAVATAGVLAGTTRLLLRADLLGDPSPFLWPVLALGGLLFAAVVAKAFELWIRRDHRTPGQGMGALLVLSGLVLALGAAGAMSELYRLAATLSASPELARSLVLPWLVRDCALLSVAILLALAGGLAWFVLRGWLTLVTGAHHDLLGHPAESTYPKETRS